MSGGYTPNSNFGDDIGIFEYIREECFGGADAFVYQIFNPNNVKLSSLIISTLLIPPPSIRPSLDIG